MGTSLTEIKTLIEKSNVAWIEKRKEDKTPNWGNHSQSICRNETPSETKTKALKGLYFHQEITKTEAQEIIPRIIVKNTLKRKETFFQRVGQLQENLKPLKSQLIGKIEMLESQSKKIIR